jgi:uncharacterized protein (UPF0264 family)
MRLLVSVRAEREVAAALAGGADIIDAKEPARGSLGAVTPPVLGAIAALVPPGVPFSVALGDPTTPEQARRAVSDLTLERRAAPIYVKLGAAGFRSVRRVTAMLDAALEAAARLPGDPVPVPVAYADHARAATLPCEQVLESAVAAGASAFLIDTYIKDGAGLLDWIEPDRLRRLVETARTRGLLVALAGSLDLTAIDRVAGLADVIGIRGAACRGGRQGVVDRELVGRVRERLLAAAPPLGETRGPVSGEPRSEGPSICVETG